MVETLMPHFKGDAVPFAFQVKLEVYLRFSYLQDLILVEKESVIQGISDFQKMVRDWFYAKFWGKSYGIENTVPLPILIPTLHQTHPPYFC